jgi:hypothetical protein
MCHNNNNNRKSSHQEAVGMVKRNVEDAIVIEVVVEGL